MTEKNANMTEPAPLMNVNDLFITNLLRARRWHVDGIEEWSALEWAGAMAGEAGEAANAAKKLKRLENRIASLNHEERHFTDIESARRAVAKETADVIIYGLLVMARVGITDPAQIIAEVFNRKSEEYGFPERI
jgi:NTP pyrophosphatase (non-canonical NTP hydrolase)